MTDSLAMTKYRNATVLGNVAHELPRTPRNDQINISIERQHLRNIFARVQQVDRSRRNIQKMADGIAPNRYECLIRMRRFSAAFEDHRVARLQGQRGHLRNDFRTGLKNDADDSD